MTVFAETQKTAVKTTSASVTQTQPENTVKSSTRVPKARVKMVASAPTQKTFPATSASVPRHSPVTTVSVSTRALKCHARTKEFALPNPTLAISNASAQSSTAATSASWSDPASTLLVQMEESARTVMT